ncbi:Amidohydrolase [Fusarium sp. LHS14.1]|nr:Amidohydrolase [Fusarium sp. LHS14.1]
MIFLPIQLLALSSLAQSTWASSIVLRKGTIIGWNENLKSLEVTRKGSLVITDDRITGIYAEDDEPTYPKDAEIIDATGKIITPGFVDTHRHNWQTAWRTANSNLTIHEYFPRVFTPKNTGSWSPEDIYNSHLLGIYEGLNFGVTTMLDHAHHSWSREHGEAGFRASLDSGARVIHAYNLGSMGYGNSLEDQVDDLKRLYKSYGDVLDKSLVTLGVASDLFAFLDEEALAPVLKLLSDYDVAVLTTHMLGGPYGVDNNPERLHQLGLLNTSMPVIIGHASFLEQHSYKLLQATNQYASITIESEMFVGQTNPTAHHWLDQAALGIDSFFMFSSDLLTQARMLLAYVRNALFSDALAKWEIPGNSPMSVSQAFLVATRSGGQALRRPDLGIIAAGAKADILVWDTTNLAMTGWIDPIAAILNHANPSDIQDVLVDGVFKKRGGKLLIADLDQAKSKFEQTARKVQATLLASPRVEVKGGERYISGARVRKLRQVDVIRGDGDGSEFFKRASSRAGSHDEL